MSDMASFVNEVEEAIASKDSSRRVDTLRRLTGLFVDQEPQLGEGHVEIFDEVILRLSRDLEQRARIELSEKFSELAKAPRKVIRSLAFDQDGSVARPVLERSPRLDDDDLLMIARARGQDHLLAISKRDTLSERVTDVLVNRGDEVVVRSVAGNDGARFSEGGFNQLLVKAREDAVLQTTLHSRRDIPPKQMQRLVEIAQEQARHTLKAELGAAAAADVDAALAGAAKAVAQAPGTGVVTDNFDAAVGIVQRRAASGGLAEADVVEWIRLGKIDEALAALAHLAGVPVPIVARAYRSPHYDPLLFILRSVRFGWGTFKAFLTAKAGRAPPPEIMRSAFEAFQQLSVQTAQRVVRFTAARERAAQTDAA
ncbi:MAG TPA: DUF2336 domain-containing protein [Microvirga sp.]|jgi:uncharacterized protein (DUF2336 family)|nr:DUF2336 domain-containing protein [Microvirga sp.]